MVNESPIKKEESSSYWEKKEVFIRLDENGFVLAYGSSRMTAADFVIPSEELAEDFFNNPFQYQLVDNVLIFNDTKAKKDEEDRNALRNQLTEKELIENLTEKKNALQAELLETQLALVEIYETLLGGES